MWLENVAAAELLGLRYVGDPMHTAHEIAGVLGRPAPVC